MSSASAASGAAASTRPPIMTFASFMMSCSCVKGGWNAVNNGMLNRRFRPRTARRGAFVTGIHGRRQSAK